MGMASVSLFDVHIQYVIDVFANHPLFKGGDLLKPLFTNFGLAAHVIVVAQFLFGLESCVPVGNLHIFVKCYPNLGNVNMNSDDVTFCVKRNCSKGSINLCLGIAVFCGVAGLVNGCSDTQTHLYSAFIFGTATNSQQSDISTHSQNQCETFFHNYSSQCCTQLHNVIIA